MVGASSPFFSIRYKSYIYIIHIYMIHGIMRILLFFCVECHPKKTNVENSNKSMKINQRFFVE